MKNSFKSLPLPPYAVKSLYYIALYSIISAFLLLSCDPDDPKEDTPTLKTLRGIVEAGEIPTDLSSYSQEAQEALAPLVGKSLGTFYVTVSGGSATTQDGSSWDAAYAASNLKTAIDAAGTAISKGAYLVLVAGGTYPVSTTLNMKNNVAIIGGLNSDWTYGKTTLDGGGTTLVFSNSNLNNTAVLYRLSITNGRGTDGGGMYNSFSSPTIKKVIFSSNTASSRGGGMHNSSSSPILNQVTFSSNTANSDGGGMFNNFYSSPILNQVTFSSNTATSNGGGMFNSLSSSPTLSQVTFSTNTATSHGGGGGGMYNNSSSPTLSQVTFSSNTASSRGGGMYNNSSSSPNLNQVTFSTNTATSGGGMFNDNNGATGPTIINSLFWGNTQGTNTPSQIYFENAGSSAENLKIYYSIVQGANDAARFLKSNASGGAAVNITQYGLVDTTDLKLSSSLADNGGFVQTLSLESGSPAINAGIYLRKDGSTYYYSEDASAWYTAIDATNGLSTSATLPSGAIDLTATDARGYAITGRPDLGAYEFSGTAP